MKINVKVYAKIRPSDNPCLTIKNNTITMRSSESQSNLSFQFDKVLHTNQGLYRAVTKNTKSTKSVERTIILCYGQSGAGKTTTLFNTGAVGSSGCCSKCDTVMASVQEDEKVNFNDQKNDKKKSTKAKGTGGLLHHILSNNSLLSSKTFFIYNEKIQNKVVVKPTALNKYSSRGHLFVQLIATPKQKENPSKRVRKEIINLKDEQNSISSENSLKEIEEISRKETSGGLVHSLTLVDLAGSENNRKTKHTPDTLRESCSINQSLFCLNRVVSYMSGNMEKKNTQRGKNNGSETKQDGYIPWRGSVLTRKIEEAIFSDVQNGDAKSSRNNISEANKNENKNMKNKSQDVVTLILLIHIRNDASHFQETLNTLRFSELSRSIDKNEIKSGKFEKKEESVWDRLSKGTRSDRVCADTSAMNQVSTNYDKNINENKKSVLTKNVAKKAQKKSQKRAVLGEKTNSLTEKIDVKSFLKKTTKSNPKLPIRNIQSKKMASNDEETPNESDLSFKISKYSRNIDDLLSSFNSNEIVHESIEQIPVKQIDSLDEVSNKNEVKEAMNENFGRSSLKPPQQFEASPSAAKLEESSHFHSTISTSSQNNLNNSSTPLNIDKLKQTLTKAAETLFKENKALEAKEMCQILESIGGKYNKPQDGEDVFKGNSNENRKLFETLKKNPDDLQIKPVEKIEQNVQKLYDGIILPEMTDEIENRHSEIEHLLNNGTHMDLKTKLRGIGDVRANRIIAMRNEKTLQIKDLEFVYKSSRKS